MPDDDGTKIVCNMEDPKSPKTQTFLEKCWREAQFFSGVKAKHDQKRPQVCYRQGAPIINLNGNPVFVCGYYTPEDNTVLACDDPLICGSLRCTVIHEYLHALLGPGHAKHPPIMEKAGCSEDEK